MYTHADIHRCYGGFSEFVLPVANGIPMKLFKNFLFGTYARVYVSFKLVPAYCAHFDKYKELLTEAVVCPLFHSRQ